MPTAAAAMGGSGLWSMAMWVRFIVVVSGKKGRQTEITKSYHKSYISPVHHRSIKARRRRNC